ncbi:MAG TPA: hypothetical protein VF066_15275, partial [Thermoleophilaceae bacterium]
MLLLLVAVVVVLDACGSQPTGTGSGQRPAAKAVPKSGSDEVDLDPAAIAKARTKAGTKGPESGGGGRPQVVVAVPPGMAKEQESLTPSRRSRINRAKEDAQIRKDLAEFRKFLSTIPPASGRTAEVTPQGQAAVPFD